jgi:hypothetical protein
MPRRSGLVTFVLGGTLALLGSLAAGCGGGSSGVHVKGKVTFKGQPVPGGKVYISPDASKGGSGQTGFADIKNGEYDTRAAGGRGTTAGAVVFAVEGIDPNPPAGAAPDVTTTILFARYEMKGDVPTGGGTQDIDVPDAAANAPASKPEGVVTP